MPLSRMRAAVAATMTASAAVPQFTIERRASLGTVDEWRRRRGVSLSDILTAVVAKALSQHPRLNASFTPDGIVEHEDRNIGLAVALDDGLVAPAVLRADTLSLAELRDERERLTKAATAGSLRAVEVASATFTISNLGPFGVERFRALVVPPQAAILAVGASAAELVSLSLSVDHRVTDGAPAARFLADVVRLLEQPHWLDGLLP